MTTLKHSQQIHSSIGQPHAARFLKMSRLLLYRPGLFVISVLSWALAWTPTLLSGLLTRAIFDTLSGRASLLGLNIWALGALLLTTEGDVEGLSLGGGLGGRSW